MDGIVRACAGGPSPRRSTSSRGPGRFLARAPMVAYSSRDAQLAHSRVVKICGSLAGPLSVLSTPLLVCVSIHRARPTTIGILLRVPHQGHLRKHPLGIDRIHLSPHLSAEANARSPRVHIHTPSLDLLWLPRRKSWQIYRITSRKRARRGISSSSPRLCIHMRRTASRCVLCVSCPLFY